MTLKAGTPEQFTRLREELASFGWTESELCRRLGLASPLDFDAEAEREQTMPWDDHPAGVLTRLFIEGWPVETDVAVRQFGTEFVQTIADLGLIETFGGSDAQVASTVALYPLADLWLASDRWNNADRSPYRPVPDVVYPAIASNAQRFVRLIPRDPCRSFLDLCGGCGVAAVLAARHFARSAVAADIAGRATAFAAFNAALNGADNADAVTGDMYAPVDDREFDRIVVHPPYVPVLRPKYIYHDGGEDGEQVVRRAITEMPGHLAPGGTLYLLAMLSDRTGEPIEARVRRWLGDAGNGFDVAAFPMYSLEPEDFASRAVLTNPTPNEDYRRFRALLRTWQVERMFYTAIYVRRLTEDRAPFTIRRQASLRTPPDAVFRTLSTEVWLRQPGGQEALLGARVVANRETTLEVPHRLGDDGWEVAEYILSARSPFSMEARTDPWVAHMLALADGSRTVEQLHGQLVSQELVPAQASIRDFTQAVGLMLSGGFLTLRDAQ